MVYREHGCPKLVPQFVATLHELAHVLLLVRVLASKASADGIEDDQAGLGQAAVSDRLRKFPDISRGRHVDRLRDAAKPRDIVNRKLSLAQPRGHTAAKAPNTLSHHVHHVALLSGVPEPVFTAGGIERPVDGNERFEGLRQPI